MVVSSRSAMGLESILSIEAIAVHAHATCKREVMSLIAERTAAIAKVDQDSALRALMEREKLGTTAVGRGVCIPHGKVEGLSKITGVLATLSDPIEFDAPDGEPIDIVFGLMAPTDATAAHLKALAKVSRMMRDEQKREALRLADSVEAMFAIASQAEHSDAA